MQRLNSKEGLVGLDDLEWRERYNLRKSLCRFTLLRKLTGIKDGGIDLAEGCKYCLLP
jgi:hypothetical protein